MARVHANGIDIEYESFGRESDPALLLIMGFGAQLTLWPRAFCEGLAGRGFRVIRFDNRDAGKSTRLTDKGVPDVPRLLAQMAAGEPVAAPYLLSDMAADAVGLLDALRVDRAHIVGASMGGMIAQLVAAEHPRRTKSLVSIMSTTGRRDLPQPKPEAMVALTQPPASTCARRSNRRRDQAVDHPREPRLSVGRWRTSRAHRGAGRSHRLRSRGQRAADGGDLRVTAAQ